MKFRSEVYVGSVETDKRINTLQDYKGASSSFNDKIAQEKWRGQQLQLKNEFH